MEISETEYHPVFTQVFFLEIIIHAGRAKRGGSGALVHFPSKRNKPYLQSAKAGLNSRAQVFSLPEKYFCK